MGVQNLWVLLAPVGRQVEIESLATKVLAVDASIWLTQFVKAMRDDEGNMIRNAHLIGTFHRVAKLLFYRIRPVFVFDGQTPELKKRTVSRRRKRQEVQAANLRQTAQMILLNRLKLHRGAMKKGSAAAASAVDESFVLPGEGAAKAASETQQSEADGEVKPAVIEIADSSDVEGSSEKDYAVSEAKDVVDATEEQDKESDIEVEDVVIGCGNVRDIDLEAVFALPVHLQKDVLLKIQRERRQEAREEFIPLAGNPEAYSLTQIRSFLTTSALNKKIEAARRKYSAAGQDGRGDQSPDVMPSHGRRIASESNRFFIYEKGSDSPHDIAKTDGQNHEESDDEVMKEVESVSQAERKQVDEQGRLSLLERFQQKRRRKHEDESGKERLTDFSVASIKEFTKAAERKQNRSWTAERLLNAQHSVSKETTDEKVTRDEDSPGAQDLEESKPEDSKFAEAQSVPISNEHESADEKNKKAEIVVTFKVDEAADASVKFENLFPASMFEQPVMTASRQTDSKEDVKDAVADNDDVEWEEVPMTETFDTSVEPTTSQTVITINDSEEEDVEWEEVSKVANKVAVVAPSVEKVDLLDHETKSALNQLSSEYLSDQEEDDTFTAFKSEMEEAKGEDDLQRLRDEALHSAIATATNLTQWAAGAVRKALAQHTQQPQLATAPDHKVAEDPRPNKHVQDDEKQVSTEIAEVDDNEVDEEQSLRDAIARSLAEDESAQPSRYLQYDIATKAATSEVDEIDILALQKEQSDLRKLRSRQQRDTEGFNEEMVEDVMELLRLFGVPFLVAPMEAEAQCAALEQLGLVDGIITDDSDIFAFGGKKVYKNIFHHQKFVEAFLAQDVQKELGFSQDDIIALAMLLGSDYTEGIRGIGIVNATEIVNAYPGIEGLREFKKWVEEFDLAEKVLRDKKRSEEELAKMTPRERFQATHTAARRKWTLGEEFPNAHVVNAYFNPQVDRSEAKFSWALPDLAALRGYCSNTFGWDQAKTDGVLLPLMEQQATTNRPIQTRIDHFFRAYDDDVKYAKIRSKRLRSAVLDMTTKEPAAKSKQQNTESSPSNPKRAVRSTSTKRQKKL